MESGLQTGLLFTEFSFRAYVLFLFLSPKVCHCVLTLPSRSARFNLVTVSIPLSDQCAGGRCSRTEPSVHFRP